MSLAFKKQEMEARSQTSLRDWIISQDVSSSSSLECKNNNNESLGASHSSFVARDLLEILQRQTGVLTGTSLSTETGSSSGSNFGMPSSGTGKSGSSKSCTLPNIIRDIEFVSPLRASSHPHHSDDEEEDTSSCTYSHAVLDPLLSFSSKPSAEKNQSCSSISGPSLDRSLLLYLARVDTLHPVTICRSLLWAGENKALLLALASVISSKAEMRGDGGARSGGPARLPGWEKIAVQEYRFASRKQGEEGRRGSTSTVRERRGSRRSGSAPTASNDGPIEVVQKVQFHTAALAEACVAALAIGAHSSLLLLLQVLNVAITAQYTRQGVRVSQSEKMKELRGVEESSNTADNYSSQEKRKIREENVLAAFHITEARLVSALQILMNYSASTSFVGSALGNLTAHLPTVNLPEYLVPPSAKEENSSVYSSQHSKKGEGFCVIRDPSLVSSVMDRKKEATLNPGVCRPIKLSNETDITPLTESSVRPLMNRKLKRQLSSC